MVSGCGTYTGSRTTTERTPVALKDFQLTGDLTSERASFELTANARVDKAGASIDLLSGRVALTEVDPQLAGNITVRDGTYVLSFDRAGVFPIRIRFDTAVRHGDGWHAVDFRVAPGALRRVVLRGLDPETQFRFAGAARPERIGSDFVSHLPADGVVNLSWKEEVAAAEGKLFYSAEMLSQVTVSPGLMRQVALLEFRVMQGELDRVFLLLQGTGEVTRVQGDQVLAWNVEAIEGSQDRRLTIRLNQPQKGQFALQVQMQTPLGAFPQSAEAMRLRPEDAVRFAGHVRIVNEGAVRLEVSEATGLSQVAPEQFPESDATRALFRAGGNQRFVYRFSGADFALGIHADQVLPELFVSEVLSYHLGENEQIIEAEVELDVREAPLRELLMRIPRGYAIARLQAGSLIDYFVREPAEAPDSELRLVFGQPLSGRQVIQLRIERNEPLGQANWALPRIEVVRAKSVRGFVGVSSDAGMRLTPDRTEGLTDVATAFFPRKLPNIHAAFRLNEPAWEAVLGVERLPQTVDADVFHLFSIGEGVAYGSSVMNYLVSGAPIQAFRVELSPEYSNVEFTGKDIRNRQRVEGGYLVQLHTPVSGPYVLLATYDRTFRAQGETLAFAGARPLDAQSEKGHTIIISAHQFEVRTVEVSANLLALEPGEVPPEYRLFFDAPILGAYRYSARPFNLQLALTPLAQGNSLNQVVDRAVLHSRVSKEGHVLTDARYFVKNRGYPHLRVTLPGGTTLWSATVNGARVVPVTDASAHLIPLPQNRAPDSILDLQLKLAASARDAERVTISAPTLAAPVMLAEWNVEPEPNQRLVYQAGSLTPAGGIPDNSGFGNMARLFSGGEAGQAGTLLLALLVLTGAALVVWRWAALRNGGTPGACHLAGGIVGLIAFVLALVSLAWLGQRIDRQSMGASGNLTFLAPVQQAGSALTVELANVPDGFSMLRLPGYLWPVFVAMILFVVARITGGAFGKVVARAGAWTVLAWAALRMPHGGVAFVIVVTAALIVQVAVPALRGIWSAWQASRAPAPGEAGAAPALTAWLIVGLMAWTFGFGASAQAAQEPAAIAPATNAPIVQSVIQEVRVEDKFAFVTATIRWEASRGESLLLLEAPAVPTRIDHPPALRLVQSGSDVANPELLATESGTFEIELEYQVEVTATPAESSVILPVALALVNRLNLTIVDADVDVRSPQAVSVERETAGSNTVARIVLSPSGRTRLEWRPRSRDVRREKPVYYAEFAHLFVPMAGVIEGVHHLSIRPAQGELNELALDVPERMTITDVTGAGSDGGGAVSLWRFDPDQRKLRITLTPAQSRPFSVVIQSQVAAGTLPFEQRTGLLSLDNVAGQIGVVGIATGNDVQLDAVDAGSLSAINLEDFPGYAASVLQGRIPGLMVRRAFRYTDRVAQIQLTASAVEPDVRVETQDTLSLGEDRVVVAVNATVAITRAGIFRLSFPLPEGFDVESISGPAMSHWTEARTESGRVITLHLPGKTQGQHSFSITLSGGGLRTTNDWPVPEVIFREASKQRGTLLVVPELGMRVLVAERGGVTQLDPEKAGIRQKGVLAFRVLQAPSALTLDIEQVDAWVQVNSLQQANITEGQIAVSANLHYQIENTGLRSLRVLVPTNAESVRFQGEQMAGFTRVPGAETNGLQEWEIKLHRRVIGPYLLRVSCQTPVPGDATDVVIRGVQAEDVNVQRGFVTLQSDPRLQVSAGTLPASLQPSEWQAIPRALLRNASSGAASLTYRLAGAAFELPLRVQRHDAARLLPARVNNVTLNSVVSDNALMLTHVRMEIVPGDKRLLHFTLPEGGRFWFGFVNRNGVWPWREQDRILVPLERQSRGDEPVSVEIFYDCRAGTKGSRSLDLTLLAPKFDLPLEDITWRVSLGEKWRVTDWSGDLGLQREEVSAVASDLREYLAREVALQQERTAHAEKLLAEANSALERGDPNAARRAFQAAYGLSFHDSAFNEDARVQLHNLKLQQALVGLSVRQSAVSGRPIAFGDDGGAAASRGVRYTQQDARDLMDRNTADENAAFMKLAERLIQQQEAATVSASALRATLPEQGRVLSFKRSVLVDPMAPLRLELEASVRGAGVPGMRLFVVGGVFVVLLVLLFGARSIVRVTA